MHEPAYMTPRGRNALVTRLRRLETELREVTVAKGEAAEVGGNAWHDNFAFEQLCRDELMLRRRVADLTALLARAAEPPPPAEGEVGVGCRVTLEHEDGSLRTVSVVGIGESDPEAYAVEYVTPIGRAVFGFGVGDDVTIRAPKMKGTWTIVRVESINGAGA